MSPFHSTKSRICSLLLSSSLVGSSRHLEYLDDGVFLLSSGDSRGNLVCREMLPYRMMETSGSWVRPWLQAGVFATHFFDPQRCSQTGKGVGSAPSTGYIMYLAVYPSNHGKTSTKKISPVRDWRSTSFECIGVGGGGAGEAFASPSPNFGQQIFFRQDVNAEFTFFTYSY